MCLTMDLLGKWLEQTKTPSASHQHPLNGAGGVTSAAPTKNEISTGVVSVERRLETIDSDRTKGENDMDSQVVSSSDPLTTHETTANGSSDVTTPSSDVANPSGDVPDGVAAPSNVPLATPSGDEATDPIATPLVTSITGSLPLDDVTTSSTDPLAMPSQATADQATVSNVGTDPVATPSTDEATNHLATPSTDEAGLSANHLATPSVDEATPSTVSNVATPTADTPATPPEAASAQLKESNVTSDSATPTTEPGPSLPTSLPSADSDHPPRSKHNFHITALSVFAPPSSGEVPPAKIKSPDSSPSILVTGVTVSRPHGLLPVLLVHRVNSKASPSIAPKATPIQVPFSATPENLLDFADTLSNPIPLSTSTIEDPVTVDFVTAVPLEECMCVTCMPEVQQVIPLAGGTLLAVTCSTTDERNKKRVVLMLYQVSMSAELLLEPLSAISVLSTNCYINPVSNCGGPADDVDGVKGDIPLLASVNSEGEVVLYSCSVEEGLNKLCSCSAQLAGGKADVATGCTYCPTTLQLLVAFRGGTVASVKFCKTGFLDQIDAGASANIPMPPEFVEHDLSSEDFDHILDIVGVSPVGVPFSCSSQACWKEISLLQLNRRSPLHMNMPPTHAEVDSSVSDGRNGRILQYLPPLETLAPSRLV